ncbi:MAG: hypothetical protein VKJ04_05180, partial [Vampirovibrionales bacterium]|nr:hypothetical protein [Vampirovibrionales bacterium]
RNALITCSSVNRLVFIFKDSFHLHEITKSSTFKWSPTLGSDHPAIPTYAIIPKLYFLLVPTMGLGQALTKAMGIWWL